MFYNDVSFLKGFAFFSLFPFVLFEKYQPGKQMCGLSTENLNAKGHHLHLLPTAGDCNESDKMWVPFDTLKIWKGLCQQVYESFDISPSFWNRPA